jgi:hypothetical protein
MFLFSKSSSSTLGDYKTHYSIDSAVKRPKLEVGHSSPSSAEVKNEWSCTSTSLIVLFLNRVYCSHGSYIDEYMAYHRNASD